MILITLAPAALIILSPYDFLDVKLTRPLCQLLQHKLSLLLFSSSRLTEWKKHIRLELRPNEIHSFYREQSKPHVSLLNILNVAKPFSSSAHFWRHYSYYYL